MAGTRILLDTGPLMAYVNRRCQVLTTDRDFLIYCRRGRHVIPLLSPFAS
jgi:hypothetical protein